MKKIISFFFNLFEKQLKPDEIRTKKFQNKKTWKVLDIEKLSQEDRIVVINMLEVSMFKKLFPLVSSETKRLMIISLENNRRYTFLKEIVLWCSSHRGEFKDEMKKQALLVEMLRTKDKHRLQEVCFLSQDIKDIYSAALEKLIPLMTFQDWKKLKSNNDKEFSIEESFREKMMKTTASNFHEYCDFMKIFDYPGGRGTEIHLKLDTWFNEKIEAMGGIDKLNFQQIVDVSHYGKYTYMFGDAMKKWIKKEKPSIDTLKKWKEYYIKYGDDFGINRNVYYFNVKMIEKADGFQEMYDLYKYFKTIKCDDDAGLLELLYNKLETIKLSIKEIKKLYDTEESALINIAKKNI